MVKLQAEPAGDFTAVMEPWTGSIDLSTNLVGYERSNQWFISLLMVNNRDNKQQKQGTCVGSQALDHSHLHGEHQQHRCTVCL